MLSPVPEGYAGAPLPALLTSLLAILDRHGFTRKVSTRFAGKTINVMHDGVRCGYINNSVLQRDGVIGYHFAPWGRATNDCPPKIADVLVPLFCERYGCQSGELVVQHGTGTNAGRTFLIIKDPTVALKVLMQDAGKTLDEAVQITKVKGKYIEGAIRDVVMQGYERSPKARQACLVHYGYNCYACGTNIYTRYRGLSSELIHVHHEEPLGAASGPREVDPVADMKPLCPNCHAVIHSRKPPYSIAQLKEMFTDET